VNLAKSTVRIAGSWVTQTKRNGEVGTFWRDAHDRALRRPADREGSGSPRAITAGSSPRQTLVGAGTSCACTRTKRRSRAHTAIADSTPKRGFSRNQGNMHKANYTRSRNQPESRVSGTSEVVRDWASQTTRRCCCSRCRCATCPSTSADTTHPNLHVDHDHASGRIEGCSARTAIGLSATWRDDATRLRDLAGYLDRGGVS